MFTNGDRDAWLNAVATRIMDGGNSPPSIDLLNINVPPIVVTRVSDGYCTVAAARGLKSGTNLKENDLKEGWRIIINEMIALLREQGFVGGSDDALTWIKPRDGTWKVSMPGNRQYLVFGQAERRMSRDRAVVGERDEITGDRTTRGIFETGKARPLELDVVGPRGGTTRQKFEVHPLALLIPPMTEYERETLRAGIERVGVLNEITIYEKKILDGRNRSYFASILNKPVKLKFFEGTKEQAVFYVAAQNLQRRHLSKALQVMIVIKLFGEEADQQIRQAHKQGSSVGGQSRGKARVDSPAPSRGKEEDRWEGIVASKAKDIGLDVTPASVRAMKEVSGAVDTWAKIQSGEIKTVSGANKEARKEKGMLKSTTFQGVRLRSYNKHLGEVLYHFNAMLTDSEMPVGNNPDQIEERYHEIGRIYPELGKALRKKGFIK